MRDHFRGTRKEIQTFLKNAYNIQEDRVEDATQLLIVLSLLTNRADGSYSTAEVTLTGQNADKGSAENDDDTELECDKPAQMHIPFTRYDINMTSCLEDFFKKVPQIVVKYVILVFLKSDADMSDKILIDFSVWLSSLTKFLERIDDAECCVYTRAGMVTKFSHKAQFKVADIASEYGQCGTLGSTSKVCDCYNSISHMHDGLYINWQCPHYTNPQDNCCTLTNRKVEQILDGLVDKGVLKYEYGYYSFVM